MSTAEDYSVLFASCCRQMCDVVITYEQRRKRTIEHSSIRTNCGTRRASQLHEAPSVVVFAPDSTPKFNSTLTPLAQVALVSSIVYHIGFAPIGAPIGAQPPIENYLTMQFNSVGQSFYLSWNFQLVEWILCLQAPPLLVTQMKWNSKFS